MPHLPTTWKERTEADRERRVERAMTDQRLQWTRTQKARRLLAVLAAALCAAMVPAFALGGTVAGIVVSVGAFAAWGLLRFSTRTLADLPDRFLDERQRAIRNRSYFYAYLILGWIVAGVATVGLILLVVVSKNDSVTVSLTWDQVIGPVLSVTLLVSLLPTLVLAWRDPGERADQC